MVMVLVVIVVKDRIRRRMIEEELFVDSGVDGDCRLT